MVTDREVDHWELVLAGCPGTWRYMFWACFAYAWVLGTVLATRQSGEPHLMARGTSAFFMMFHAMSLAATTGAPRRRTG